MSSLQAKEALERFPRIALATLPTPVLRLERLGAALGLAELWIKRDDLSSPHYGGNKVRKLEFLLAEALVRRAASLLTVGAVGSHHVLATARFGRDVHLGVRALVTPQAPEPYVRANLMLGARWGVVYEPVKSALWLPAVVARELRRHPETYFIPPGGSSPLGTLGFVAAALELAEQIRGGEMPMPRAIVVATGSAGTHAGLLVGLACAGLRIPVIGVRVVPWPLASAHRVAWLANHTARLLGAACRHRWGAEEIQLSHAQFGDGYGVPTLEARRMIALAQAHEGLVLEGAYTAKAMAGLLAVASRNEPVLFWHTYDGADLSAERAAVHAASVSLPPELSGYFQNC